MLSVYQRNDHPSKNIFLPHKYIQDIQTPSCPSTEAGNTMMAGLKEALPGPQDPPKLLLLPKCSRPQQGKFLIQRTSSGLTPWQRLWLSKVSTYGQELAGSFWLKNCSLEKHWFPEKFCGSDHITVNFSN